MMNTLSLSTVRQTQVQCTEYSAECTGLKHSLLYLRTVKNRRHYFLLIKHATGFADDFRHSDQVFMSEG